MIKQYNKTFKLLFRILMIILTIYYAITYKTDAYRINYISNGVIILISSLAADLIFKILKIRISSAMDFFLQFFIFLALFLGRMYNFYSVFSWWDLFLHFLSGVLFAVLFLALLKFMTGEEAFSGFSPLFVALFIVMFSVAGAALWEFWEFAGDQLLGFDSQLNSLTDTMSDMIMGSISGLVVGILAYFNIKKHLFKFLDGFINGFEHEKK